MKQKTHILGFTNISDKEAVMFIEGMISERINEETGDLKPALTKEEALDDITLIDNLLSVQRTYNLLSRKRGLKNQLSAVIGNHIGVSDINLNVKPKKSEIL